MRTALIEHDPLTAAQRAVKVVDEIIQQGVLKGKRVRVSDDGRIAVIHALQLVGMTDTAARQCISRASKQRASKKVVTNLSQLQFEGRGQRGTWVADAQGLINILGNIKGKKYAKFTAEIQALKDYVTSRFLGGSKTLQVVSDAIADL